MADVITKEVDMPFEEAEERFLEELEERGFDDVWEMDWNKMFGERLGLDDYPQFSLYGVCNPSLAYDVIEEEPENAAFLPCSILVRETEDGTELGVVNPIMYASSMGGDPMEVLTQAQKKIMAAFDSV